MMSQFFSEIVIFPLTNVPYECRTTVIVKVSILHVIIVKVSLLHVISLHFAL